MSLIKGGIDMSVEDSSPVDPQVLAALIECRDVGATVMTDMRMVLRWLRDEGRYGAAEWVEKNPTRYLSALEVPAPPH